ncbi:MAG: DMT family transporter [Aggregatilineales bacterium]
MTGQQIRGAIYGISAAAIWGGMYVVSDVVLQVIPPFTLLSLRLIIGVVIVGLILRREVIIPRRDALKLIGVGLIGFGVSLGAQFVGTKFAGAINGSVVTSASPAFILLFAWLLLREPLTLARIGAVALASVGVLVVLDLSHFDLSTSVFGGNVALTIAALTWGLYSVLVRLVSKTYSTLTISFYALLGGTFIALPAAVIELPSNPVGTITFGVVLGVLYLGVISTALAMVLWNRAFALVEASVASLFFFAQPLVGVLLASVFLNQQITASVFIGGALIIVGVLLSMLRVPFAVAQQHPTSA